MFLNEKMHIAEETCRVCLGKQRLNEIFKKDLPEKIKYCASIQLSEDDDLPKRICNQCLFYLDIAYIFRTVCESTDARLRKYFTEQKRVIEPGHENFDDVFFTNSPLTNEIVIGEDVEEEINLEDNAELELTNNKILLEDNKDEKPKIGRHTAKKNSAKCPKRVPPTDEAVNIENITEDVSSTNEDIKEHTCEEASIDSGGSIDQRKTYQCDKCCKSFPYKSHLIRHLSVHSGVKKYKCAHCNKKFINRYNLSVHMQKHTGNFPLQCQLCNRGFSSPSLLKRHLNSHSGNTKFQCKYCPKKLLHLSSLKLHEKMHVYRPSYTCDICFKVFSYTNSLNEHKKIHRGVKENLCVVCGKRFTRKTSLRRHMVGHSSTRKIKCKLCNLSLSNNKYKAHLYTHKKSHNRSTMQK